MRATVFWRGVSPPRGLAARLAARGLGLVLGPAPPPSAAGAAPAEVVATAAAHKVPPSPPGARAGAHHPPWIWVCRARVSLEAAAEAVRRGAYDALSLAEAGSAERLADRLAELADPEPALPPTPGVIAESPAARRVLRQVWRAARTSMPVLLTGETGTGKEVMARLVHHWSQRTGAFLPINCAAIPNELMESELFGHIRGAFSGAVATVDGKLLAASAGTVFLDEIDDTPLSIQTKLLRALEEGEVTRVGETTARKADFRIVAASNRDLRRLIAEGRFGRDLYERLAIVRVELPRLRDRPEDIPPLTRHFIATFYQRQAQPPVVEAISAPALAALQRHPWTGNIRELRNVLYQALVYKRGGRELLLGDLRALLDARPAAPERDAGRPVVDREAIRARIAARSFNLRQEVERLESEGLRLALAAAGGRPAAAARLLGEVGHGRSSDPGGTVRAMMRRLRVPGR